MRILIEKNNLIDFPYDPLRPEYHSLFSFEDEKIATLVSEILYAEPTCYLVSGYRGAGKTSFIKKVQQLCKEEIRRNAGKSKAKDMIFVYSSFSRYESQTFFLRKIIRDLYEAVRVYDLDTGKSGPYAADLAGLQRKTFFEVKNERSWSTEKTQTTQVGFEAGDLIKKILLMTIPLVTPIISEALINIFSFSYSASFGIVKWFIYGILVLWSTVKTISYVREYKKTDTETLVESSIADDDITGYYLTALLERFDKLGIKLVFVLDELDKVDDHELDNLLKEMKPWLVRGKADFIVVAGQTLTLRYYQMKDHDDAMLSSLFSKIIHVNTPSEKKLTRIFYDFLYKGIADDNNNDQSQNVSAATLSEPLAQQIKNTFAAYLYRSRRLPRTFMNLVRQDLRWMEDHAYLDAGNNYATLDEQLMDILNRLFEKINLNANVPETVKDHLVMHLFLAAKKVDVSGKVITLETFMNPYLETDKKTFIHLYPYQNLVPNLREYITQFFNECVKEKLITPPENIPAAEAGQQDTRENEPPLTPEELQETDGFRTEFLNFFSLLARLAPYVKPGEYAGTTRLNGLLKIFINEHIIEWKESALGLVDELLKYYQDKFSDNDFFHRLLGSFKSENISFNFQYQKLFEWYTNNRLRAVFDSHFRLNDSAQLSSYEQSFADFKATSIEHPVSVLFDYKFIDGPVDIPRDEIREIARFLSDYNSHTESGNYFVPVIFYKTDSEFDAGKMVTSTQQSVKAVKSDFEGKINYIILSVFSFQDLDDILKNLEEKIEPYNPLPLPMSTSKGKRSIPPQSASKSFNPDDPQKGRWGGNHVVNARKLWAHVEPAEDNWFLVHMWVESTDGSRPLEGKVTFYLHDSFQPNEITVLAARNKGEIKGLKCYEAFTVGAACDQNTTRLELDLNTLPDAPRGFKY